MFSIKNECMLSVTKYDAIGFSRVHSQILVSIKKIANVLKKYQKRVAVAER